MDRPEATLRAAVRVIPHVAYRLDAQLGEGPIWLPDEQALWFVDIKSGRIHRFHPATKSCLTHLVGGQPSFVVPVAGGALLVGSSDSIYRMGRNGYLEPLLKIAMPAHNRTNDATVDSAGRLWFGTMDDEEKRPSGALHCLEKGRLSRTEWRAVVTNGPAVNTDGNCIYHVDSGERTIWRIPLKDGACANEGEVFVKLGEHEGFPDGIVLDSEDCLWVALWDGWGVRRYAPDGSLLLHVPFPCARVTKIAFGGPDLRTAYVTTARVGLDGDALARQPLAGSLFAFETPVAGRVLPEVHLE